MRNAASVSMSPSVPNRKVPGPDMGHPRPFVRRAKHNTLADNGERQRTDGQPRRMPRERCWLLALGALRIHAGLITRRLGSLGPFAEGPPARAGGGCNVC